jgi:hypothetical protein
MLLVVLLMTGIVVHQLFEHRKAKKKQIAKLRRQGKL